MEAEIIEANTKALGEGEMKTAIVLHPEEDVIWPVQEVLEQAGFLVRKWKDRELIVFNYDQKEDCDN